MMPSLIGCLGIFATGLAFGYGAGWGHVAWIDSKRRHEQQQADDAATKRSWLRDAPTRSTVSRSTTSTHAR